MLPVGTPLLVSDLQILEALLVAEASQSPASDVSRFYPIYSFKSNQTKMITQSTEKGETKGLYGLVYAKLIY